MRRQIVRSLLTGAVALAVLFAVGCGREALNFNNTIHNHNKKLNDAGKKFGEAIDPALKDKEADPTKVEEAYKGVLATVTTLIKDTTGQKGPESASGKKLAEGYQKFLQTEKQIIETEFDKIAKALTKKEDLKATEGTLKEQIKTLLRKANEKEAHALTDLRESQKEFAKEHNLTLKPLTQ